MPWSRRVLDVSVPTDPTTAGAMLLNSRSCSGLMIRPGTRASRLAIRPYWAGRSTTSSWKEDLGAGEAVGPDPGHVRGRRLLQRGAMSVLEQRPARGGGHHRQPQAGAQARV